MMVLAITMNSAAGTPLARHIRNDDGKMGLVDHKKS